MNALNFENQGTADFVDRELVGRMAAGDRAALGTLFRGYHAPLCRFISRLTVDREVIQDVIDDTFWTVWQRAADLPCDWRVSTWLLGISYRCSLRALEQRGDGETTDKGVPEICLPKGIRHQPSESSDELIRKFNELTVDQRVLIDLVYGAGQDLEEVALVMSCRVDALRPQLRQARNSLSAVISTSDDDSSTP